jgi:hypothetical protein
MILISAGPAGSRPIVVFQLIYFGERRPGGSVEVGELARRGREFVEMVKAWDGEGCLLDDVRERNYSEMGENVKHLIGGVRESISSWRPWISDLNLRTQRDANGSYAPILFLR